MNSAATTKGAAELLSQLCRAIILFETESRFSFYMGAPGL